VIYEGPSELDGAPIVVILTGIRGDSSNLKTGGQVQSWILRRDMTPIDARRLGADASICGDCPLKEGACYVTLHHAPRSVYEAYRAGAYPRRDDLPDLRRRSIRLGSYGDPAAVPNGIWFELVKRAEGHTGYTHAWKLPRVAPLRRLLMASVDSPEEAIEARARGWRTFRTRLPEEGPVPFESICPGSYEGGERVQCVDCGQCDGARPYDLRYSFSTVAHGSGASTYRRLRLPVVE
jgi:hypothetical protein